MGGLVVTGDDGTQVLVGTAPSTAFQISGALRGEPGTNGAPGAPGATGATGPTGPTGAAGSTGATGATGAAGSNGVGVPTGGAAGQVVLANSSSSTQWGQEMYDVKAFGAVGDGTTDDSAAIQAAHDAAHASVGGIVFYPQGIYKITVPITVYPFQQVWGTGPNSSVIKQFTASTTALSLHDGQYNTFRDFSIITNGGAHTAGAGILLDWVSNGNVEQIQLMNILINGFFIGVDSETLITSSFNDIETYGCNTGFNFRNGGTSTLIQGTYANVCGVGYKLDGVVYFSFNGTACDASGTAYWLNNCSGIAFSGCGCEGGNHGTAPADGRGWYITASNNIGLYSCWNYTNPSYAIIVTGSSAVTVVGFTENSPTGTAINGISFAADCARMTLISPTTTSTNSIQAGGVITTVISDNGGSSTLPGNLTLGAVQGRLSVAGSSGTMFMLASPDGGAYNLGVDTTGTLALYGSSTATLSLELLDGTFKVDSGLSTLQALTVQGVLTTAASTTALVPLVLTHGTLATTPVADGLESDGGNLYWTTSGGARQIMVNTGTGQTLVNKTMSGASNTFTNIGLASLSATGTPSSSTYLRGDNTWATIAGGFTSPMTTTGDMIYSSSGSTAARLAVGGATAVLMGGTVPAWTTTPAFGVITATSLNKVTVTAPGTSATLTLITGSTLATAGAFSLTLTSTATTVATFPSGTVTLGALGTAQTWSAVQTFVAPVLGAATATSINKVTITAPTTSATLTLITGSTLATATAASLTLTLSSAATTNTTIPSGTHTVAVLDVAQTFTAAQTAGIWITTTTSATVTTNAATLAVTAAMQKVVNSSAAAMTLTLATASAVDGQTLIVRVYDFSAVAEGITWVNTENSTVTVPATSNGSTTLPLTVGFIFNGSTSKWRCVASV